MEKIIIIIIFGFAWGSFLNVLIYRIPRDMSIIQPPSSCPICKKKIKVYDNIPIISYHPLFIELLFLCLLPLRQCDDSPGLHRFFSHDSPG